MKPIRFEKYKKGLETSIYFLIRKVFDEFVAPGYTPEGNAFFYDWIAPEKIAIRQAEGRSIMIALSGEDTVGVIEMRNKNVISLLFVDKKYQKMGIARRLLEESIKNCRLAHPEIRKFYVHASPFSVPVYEKPGFVKTAEMQEANGIKYFPMELNDNNRNDLI